MKKTTSLFFLTFFLFVGLLSLAGYHVHYEDSRPEVVKFASDSHQKKDHTRGLIPEKTVIEHIFTTATGYERKESCANHMAEAGMVCCQKKSLNSEYTQFFQFRAATKTGRYISEFAARPPPISLFS